MTTNKSTHSQEGDSPSSPDDAQALSVLYEEFQQPIHSYVYHLLGNAEDAADVTQEVFIRACIAWDGLHDRNNLSAWLYCVAKHLSIDLLRRRNYLFWRFLAHRNRSDERCEEVTSDTPFCFPPDTGGIPAIAEREHIQLALANMPTGYAIALLLYAAREVPYHEVATMIGISPTAAATRISRAKGMFIEQYQRLGKDGVGNQR